MKSFRLSSLDDPTDEQLQAIMEQVAEGVRESSLLAQEEQKYRLQKLADEVAQLKAKYS